MINIVNVIVFFVLLKSVLNPIYMICNFSIILFKTPFYIYKKLYYTF